MRKKSQVFLLPTDKVTDKGILISLKDPKGIKIHNPIDHGNRVRNIKYSEEWQPQHLYFTINEEIKDGDWFITGGVLLQAQGILWQFNKHPRPKVIATNDPNLCIEKREMVGSDSKYTKWTFPKIGDDFTEAYARAYKDTPITEVMLEYEETVIKEDSSLALSTMGREGRTEQTLKLRPNGTVIISPVKEKMYSRNEMIQAAQDYALDCLKAAVVDKYNSVPYYVEWFNKHYPE